MILSVFYFTLFPILYCHGVKITTYSLEVINHAHFFLSKEAILNEALNMFVSPWNEGSDWSRAKILFVSKAHFHDFPRWNHFGYIIKSHVNKYGINNIKWHTQTQTVLRLIC